MAERKRVIRSSPANRQKSQTLKYWKDRNGNAEYSKALLDEIDENILYIQNYPHCSKSTKYDDTRMLGMGNYAIYFSEKPDHIVIRAFWGFKRDENELDQFLR